MKRMRLPICLPANGSTTTRTTFIDATKLGDQVVSS